MRKQVVTASVILVVVSVFCVWRLPRNGEGSRQENSRIDKIVTPAPIPQSAAVSERDIEQAAMKPFQEAAEPYMPTISDFVVKVRPFGLDQPVSVEVLKFFRTNYHGKVLQFYTDKHSWNIENGKVSSFASYFDGSDTRRNPDAEKTWYQGTAPWSKEEAVKETLSILKTLGREVPELSKVQYDADPIIVSDPQGHKVTVTPFHNVVLWDTNGAPYVIAEFRMGSSGPGRLTHWNCRSR